MTISNILKYSPEQYQYLIFETYVAYADIISVDEQDFQSIIANAAYHRFWMHEYHKLEQEFIKEITPYLGNIEISAIRDFYDEITSKVAKNYSKHLLNKARKTNIVNQPQHN